MSEWSQLFSFVNEGISQDHFPGDRPMGGCSGGKVDPVEEGKAYAQQRAEAMRPTLCYTREGWQGEIPQGERFETLPQLDLSRAEKYQWKGLSWAAVGDFPVYNSLGEYVLAHGAVDSAPSAGGSRLRTRHLWVMPLRNDTEDVSFRQYAGKDAGVIALVPMEKGSEEGGARGIALVSRCNLLTSRTRSYLVYVDARDAEGDWVNFLLTGEEA